ncbi:MAG: PLP-dependent aminotransferase family protein [Anaerolineae bacterium]|nr:PLP-dependent aminotransferase family protein [Anaerolineae bacterium]
MRIALDRDSQTPLYRQICRFLEGQINNGGLAADTRLPASRDLAVSLGVGRLTVNNAYAELESKGLIYRIPGSGTFVLQQSPAQPAEGVAAGIESLPAWQQALLDQPGKSAAQRQDELIESARSAGLISFAEGGGDWHLFPQDDFRKALMTVLKQDDARVLSYGDTAGFLPLRQTISRILVSQGIPANQEQVLITSGSQQALALILKQLVPPGECVLVENPTHMGFIDLCHANGVRMLEAPLDEQGMLIEAAEKHLNSGRVRLIYTVPNFQNPSGACLSSGRRRQLVNLAAAYGVPILEDDFVGDLRYKGQAQPALKALDKSGYVIYVGTFSKMLIPALRIGYVLCEGPLYGRLLAAKHSADIGTSTLMQRALDAYINVGRYEACLRRARSVYGRRRQAMLTALARTMPRGVTWSSPAGGLFIWLKLPEPLTADDLFVRASAAHVIYTPGSLFTPTGAPSPWLRLNFALHPPPLIESGVQRLADVIRRVLSP